MKKLAALFLMCVTPAFADVCDAANAQTVLTQCHGDLAKKADAELNKVYQALLMRWKSDGKAITLLRQSERAWVAFRGKQCALESYPAAGGSAQSMIVSMCWKSYTDQRVAVLKSELNCKEGDLTCLRPQP